MTYEYLCTACDNVWEAEQSISEAPLKVCPRCNKDAAKRQVSGGAGFILKGGGWYSDLYGSAPKKTSESSDDSKKSTDKKASEAPAGGKAESSPSSTSSDGASKGSASGSGSKGSTDSSAA